jgi:hypothetical protein
MSEPEHVSLRDHIERIFVERERVYEEREKMLRVTAEALDKRINLLNELRGGVATKAEHELLADRIRLVELISAEHAGQAKTTAVVTSVVASIIVGVISTVIGHWLSRN